MSKFGSKKSNSKSKAASTPALITMQWLTYVFWALASVAVVFLVGVITEYLLGIDSPIATENVAYSVAAAFILLPIAFTLDTFFSRKEDSNKSSASSVVMVVHSVLFAIISIVALVTAVFNLINISLNTFNEQSVWVPVAAALATFIMFALLFIRTAKHNLFTNLRMVYRYTVLVVVVAASIFALTGPFTRALDTKETRLVRDKIVSLPMSISDYAYRNHKLPLTLDSVVTENNFYNSTESKQISDLVARNLIKYTPNIKAPTVADGTTTVYYYEICGTYGTDLKTGYNVAIPMIYSEYPAYVTIGEVKAGTSCYKLSTDVSYKQLNQTSAQ
jgi:hypothetical protein